MSDRLEQTLPDALRRLADEAPTDELDASVFRRQAVRRRRRLVAAPIAAIAVVAAVVAGISLSRPHSAVPAGPAHTSACAPLQTGPLPAWARSGFSGDDHPPFATSSSGDVVAIVFASPLSAPPQPGRNNKILWVHHHGQADGARVTARLEGTDKVTHLSLPYGPSIVDMPAAGCWHLEWGSGAEHDSLNLRWSKP